MGRLALLLALAACLWSDAARLAPAAAAEDVDLALVLAVDISTSMNTEEQKLQREGYVAAFRHADLIRAITGGARGRIAVTYVEWAGTYTQATLVPWTVIASAADGEAFAAALAAAPLTHDAGTSISAGLMYSGIQFNGRDYGADRLAVDISGDGPNNEGRPVGLMRDWLVMRGVTINGLPIMLKAPRELQGKPFDLRVYYEDCVIGGPGRLHHRRHGRRQLRDGDPQEAYARGRRATRTNDTGSGPAPPAANRLPDRGEAVARS